MGNVASGTRLLVTQLLLVRSKTTAHAAYTVVTQPTLQEVRARHPVVWSENNILTAPPPRPVTRRAERLLETKPHTTVDAQRWTCP